MRASVDSSAQRASRIREERKARPEAEVWLGLLERALDEADRPPWARLEPRLTPHRAPGAPLLHQATLTVDARPARRWVRALVDAAAAAPEPPAASLARLAGRAMNALPFLGAAACDDARALEEIAQQVSADAGAVRAVARLAALPLLHGCARALAGRQPAGWTRGYCPVCGGLPSLAELRGLERTRVLRCDRCATGWELPVLVCPFCDERDHERHFSFAVDGEEQRRRVDACRSCDGYVKTMTTLSPAAPWAVPFDDLATLELDLVAAGRGLRRPDAAPFPAVVRLDSSDGVFGAARGGWA